ncbi:hypothetical protein [Streptomyces aurantiogriseus]|uniref:Uncharacterized protein n=1 Tax=Streptomyces aurantiogriseus TaxID=66870 RepID=A0A918F8G9_9ACTN|nr:hypothetical protein [Streptomyces aurantiogriseus]GGR11169.1 hypothetical protein GCM10010251_29130 [Streptomyces aurantiogriseus]
MGFDGGIWYLDCGEERAGEIVIDDGDFPWLSGRFRPGPAYGAVEPLFSRELALLNNDLDANLEEWEAVYAEIRRRVSLTSPDGPVPEFLLHIEGDRAWFRWSEESFNDD